MTNATNKFSKAFKSLVASRTLSATNTKKAQKCALLVADKRVYDALQANNVDAKRFESRAIYASEKSVKSVYAVTRDVLDLSVINENALATIKSAILAKRENAYLTKRDIECALSSDQKCDKARENVVFRRNSILSASTLAAQSQQCVDMIKTLQIVKEVARNTFEVQDNALMQKFEEQLADVTI